MRHPMAGKAARKCQGLMPSGAIPLWGQSCTLQADPLQESWQAVDLEGNGTAWELWESQAVGPKV